MKLKTRLIISFCIILFVPLLLGSVVLMGLRLVQEAESDNYTYIGSFGNVENSIQLLAHYSGINYAEVDAWVTENKERATDPEELAAFNDKVKKVGSSYLIVRRDNEIVFDGSGQYQTIFSSRLPAYGEHEGTEKILMYQEDNQSALLRQIDFEDGAGRKCTAFLVTTGEETIPETRKLMFDIMFSVTIILVITAVILIGWTYRGIVPRLRKLVTATDAIRAGNLDQSIEDGGTDEISDLFLAFEDMRKHLQATAKEKMQNEEEQRQLIRNIAHDLKTPITAVKGYAEGILDGVAKTPEKEEQYLKTICAKANEMNNLINELSLYAKIDTNRIPYNFQRINVKNYFMDCSEEIGADLSIQGVEFSYYNYVDDSVEIVADPEQLERVIHNIVGNSVKYRGDVPPVINLRVKDVGDFIQVEIEDNSKGISQQDLPHIFERMFRADASRNSKVGGSGIGLSIVKKIIEDHGGSIWATSKENVGTVMYFVLRKYEEARDV